MDVVESTSGLKSEIETDDVDPFCRFSFSFFFSSERENIFIVEKIDGKLI